MFCKKQSINQIWPKDDLLYIIKFMKKWSHRPQKGEKILTLDFCKKQSTTLTLAHKPTLSPSFVLFLFIPLSSLSLPISFLFCFSLLLPPLSAPSLSLTSHPLLFLPFYNFYHFIFCSFSHLYFIFNHDMCLSFLPLHLSLFLPVILYSLLFPI